MLTWHVQCVAGECMLTWHVKLLDTEPSVMFVGVTTQVERRDLGLSGH
jgi:hypothetical protein